MFRKHQLIVSVNETQVKEIWIDPHYEIKHANSMSDELILQLVHQLDGGSYKAEAHKAGFKWFIADMELDGKSYRLVWLLPDDASYLGVRTAYRRSLK